MRRSKPLCTLLLALLLLTCAACGQTQTEQPEDTGDKDLYMTEPVPEGKPDPVEPQDTAVDTTTTHTCTFSISCETILDNMDKCVESKRFLVPADGIVFPATEVKFSEGESVFDVLQRVCKDNAIHMESNWTPVYNSAYVEGINNLYEFDVGEGSGWGGFAAAASPIVCNLRGMTLKESIGQTKEMYRITMEKNYNFPIPNLDFDFLPVGIDIRKVLKEGVCPAIHGGMFNRVGGLIGAGMARVPMQCFEKALVAFGEKYL